MVKVMFTSGVSFQFDLKTREREMDFCIDAMKAVRSGKAMTFKVTNAHGIVRFVNTVDVANCYYFSKSTDAAIREHLLNIRESEAHK